MCLICSNISNGSQQTGHHSLQTNKRTHTATGTHNFIFYQSLLQHASYPSLNVFKTVTMPRQATTEFYSPWSCSSNSGLGKHTLQQVVHEHQTSIHSIYFVYCYTPDRRTHKYLDKFHLHSMFLCNSLLKYCHKFVLCQLQDLNGGWQTNPTLCLVTYFIFLTSRMLINFSYKLIKISFTEFFLNDYRQLIKTRYKEWTETESFSVHF